MPRPRPTAELLVPVGLGLLAVALALVATRDGLGTTPDGVSYLGAATNLADGQGLTGPFVTMVDPFTPAQALAFDGRVPFIQWPPLYPLVLGVGAALGIEPTTTARFLSALALGVTVGLTAALAQALASGGPTARRVAGLAAGALVLLSPLTALLHVLVASEHLFLPLVLGALAAGARALDDAPLADAPGVVAPGVGRSRARPPASALRWGGAAVALAAAATLTRYAGVAVVGALALGVLVLGGGPVRRRVVVAAGVAAIGAGPALVWSQWTARAAGVPTRTVAWHPPDRVQWESVVDTALGWLAPASSPTVWRLVVVGLAAAAVVLAVVGWRAPAPTFGSNPATADGSGPTWARPWLVLTALWTVAYLLAVVATHALFDRAVPIGQRILLPVLPPLAVTVVAGVARWWAAVAPVWPRPRRRAGAVVIVLAALAVVVPLHRSWWPLVEPGRPWAGPPADTPTGRWLSALPAGAVVAANDPALAWQSSARTTIALPVRSSAPTGRTNPRLAEDLAELQRGLAERDGVAVVYGSSAVLNPHVAGVGDLEANGFAVVATFDDAVVLAPVPTAPSSDEGASQ